MVTKKEGSAEYPASAYLVAENADEPSTWHLRVRDESGKPDHRLMGAAYAALYENYRGNTYQGPGKEQATAKLRSLYASEDLPWPGSSKSDDFVVTLGGEVKALEGGKVVGYLITFSDQNSPDLSGDFFTKDTDFGPHKTSATLYNHGLDIKLGNRKIGEGTIKQDEFGIWFESQLEMRDRYEKAIYELAKKGKLGWSSGTASHLVQREKVGNANKITSWPLGLDASLTPTPAEPRNIAMSLKAMKSTDIELLTQAEDAANAELEKQKLLEQERKVQMEQPANAVESALKTVQDEIKAQAELKAAREKQEQEIQAKVKELLAEAMKAAPEVKGGGSAALNLKTQQGDSEMKAFWYWMKTGDVAAYKANITLNEGDDEQGGALVPHDFSARIREKRDEASIIRLGGCEIITTSLKIVDIPVENTAEAAPAATNESAGATPVSYDMNAVEPLDTVTATLVKYTRMHRISEELVNDQKADLEAFLVRRVGRAFAKLENTLFFTAATSGSVVNVSGAGKTAAAAGSIADTDITGLYYSLPDYYRDGAIFVTATATEGLIRSLKGNPFLFMSTPQGERGDSVRNPLLGHSLFNTAAMSAVGASAKSVFFGNLNYYTVAENPGFVVKRLNERFADTGEIGYLFSQRIAGVANQTEALKHLVHPSA